MLCREINPFDQVRDVIATANPCQSACRPAEWLAAEDTKRKLNTSPRWPEPHGCQDNPRDEFRNCFPMPTPAVSSFEFWEPMASVTNSSYAHLSFVSDWVRTVQGDRL